MAVITPRSTIAPTRFEWFIWTPSLAFPLSPPMFQDAINLPNAVWGGTAYFDGVGPAVWRPWSADLARLRGMAGRFYLYPWHAQAPQSSSFGGMPRVNGPGQSGTTLVIDGLATSSHITRGDYFKVGSELKVAIHSTSADSGGNASIDFMPPLRSSPADNALLNWFQPTATFGLADDDQGQMSFDKSSRGTFQMDFVERLP